MKGRTHGAAIVGCGRIAGQADSPNADGPVLSHAQAYHRHPAFWLEAICDPCSSRRATFERTWNPSRSYASLDELLDHERPTVVSVCSKTDQHFPQLCRLLERQVPGAVIFVEKPVCERRSELHELTRQAASADRVTILVNHTRRFDPCHRRVARAVGSGSLGALVHGRCDYYGGWLNNGTHVVDTLRMWFGPLTIDRARSSPVTLSRPGDPCLDVTLLTAAGTPLDIVAFDETHYQLFEMDLRFERGRILVRDFGQQIILEEMKVNTLGERVLVPVADAPWTGMTTPFLPAVGAIADHLQGRASLADTGATLAGAAESMAIVWDALERA